MQATIQGKNTPEMKFRAGAVSATIWRNNGEKGSYSTVQLERSFKKDDKWQSTGSLMLNDLPKAVLALEKAYEYLVFKERNGTGEGGGLKEI